MMSSWDSDEPDVVSSTWRGSSCSISSEGLSLKSVDAYELKATTDLKTLCLQTDRLGRFCYDDGYLFKPEFSGIRRNLPKGGLAACRWPLGLRTTDETPYHIWYSLYSTYNTSRPQTSSLLFSLHYFVSSRHAHSYLLRCIVSAIIGIAVYKLSIDCFSNFSKLWPFGCFPLVPINLSNWIHSDTDAPASWPLASSSSPPLLLLETFAAVSRTSSRL